MIDTTFTTDLRRSEVPRINIVSAIIGGVVALFGLPLISRILGR